MVECMKKLAKLDVELTVEERNLLSVGYKNVIGARRASWRIMSSIEQKEESKGNENNVKLIKGYRQKVEDELSKICSDILTIIDEHLIPSSASGEATVFYYKMWVMLPWLYIPFFFFFFLFYQTTFPRALSLMFVIYALNIFQKDMLLWNNCLYMLMSYFFQPLNWWPCDGWDCFLFIAPIDELKIWLHVFFRFDGTTFFLYIKNDKFTLHFYGMSNLGKVTTTVTSLSSRLTRTGKRQLSNRWRDMRHVWTALRFRLIVNQCQCLCIVFILLNLNGPLFGIFLVRLHQVLQIQNSPQPTRSVLVWLSIFLFSTTRLWILLRGTICLSSCLCKVH